MEPETTVYISKAQLEQPRANGPQYHYQEDCHQVEAMDDVVEMTLAKAEEVCSRQAWCCSIIPALEDHD